MRWKLWASTAVAATVTIGVALPAVCADEKADLAQQASNPLANLISVPFQYNANFGTGSDDKTQNVLTIQPVIPFNLPQGWLLVTRSVLPIIDQPSDTTGDSDFGIGDLNSTAWLVAPPSVTGLPPELTIGLGPSIQLPTATSSRLGVSKTGLGPSAVVVYTKGKWLFGALASNLWSLGDGGDSINQMLFEPFVTYTLDDGWYLISDSSITADWNATSSERWVVPVGAGVGKTFNIDSQAVNTSLQAYWNAANTTASGDWTAQFSFQLLFPE